jgi:hypothetical protein
MFSTKLRDHCSDDCFCFFSATEALCIKRIHPTFSLHCISINYKYFIQNIHTSQYHYKKYRRSPLLSDPCQRTLLNELPFFFVIRCISYQDCIFNEVYEHAPSFPFILSFIILNNRLYVFLLMNFH